MVMRGVWSCGLAAVLVLAAAAQCRAWDAALPDGASPPMAVVDKSGQRMFVVHGRAVRAYRCTTGRVRGDKRAGGDLKTPEGVYFVVGKRAGLDRLEYGGEARVLDYPNPVDRKRGKTGSGIWVHGRGRAVRPFETRGCVVLPRGDMEAVLGLLEPGTPVLIGGRVRERPEPADRAVRQELGRLTLGKCPDGGGVRMLEGPGYWVTWRDGGPRLYWEREGGGWRLAGRSPAAGR